MKVVIFIVLFFSVFCFSQKNEENKTFYKEALTQIKNDDDKGTKIYEYLISNSTNEIQKLNYQLDLIKINIYKSKNSEALDLYFAIETDVFAKDDTELKDNYFIVGSDLAYYLGFKDYSKKLYDQIETNDKKRIKEIQRKFLDLRNDLSINSIIARPIQSEKEEKQIRDSLHNTLNEVKQFILLKKLQEYYLRNNNLEGYALYNKRLNTINDRLNIDKRNSRNYLVNKLLEKKRNQQIIEEKNLRLISIGISVIFIIVIIALIFYQRRRKLIEDFPIKGNLISDKVESQILDKLCIFEQNKGFLNPNITIAILAKELDTNVKYLSSILNNIKKKSFNNYINELRIGYIIQCLNEDKKYRLYKISHLATLCGFISQSSFTTFFKLITGITPSIYIKKLTENEE